MKKHVFLWWMMVFLVFSSPVCSEEYTLRAELISYDYSIEDNLESHCQTEGAIRCHDSKDLCFDMETSAENGETAKWLRLWLRIHIYTPKNAEWNHPQQYCQAMSVRNVDVGGVQSVYYSTELLPASNAFPADCTPDTLDDSYDGWEEYWERLFPDWTLFSCYDAADYWSQSLKDGETEWILELFLEDKGWDEQDIHDFVNSMEIRCEIDYCESVSREIELTNGNAKYERRFDESAVQFRADSFFTESLESLCMDGVSQAVRSAPEKYSVVGLSITMLKAMPWAICNVEASVVPDDFVIEILTKSTDAIYDRDRWKNGFYTLYPISLVVKTGDMNEQQLKEALKNVTLYLSFSTEFAGKNDFSRTESSGYSGIHFQLQVDMDDLLTLDEILEKVGDICNG